LVYYEHFTQVDHAIDREKEIKKWRREKKDNLISTHNPEWRFLNESFLSAVAHHLSIISIAYQRCCGGMPVLFFVRSTFDICRYSFESGRDGSGSSRRRKGMWSRQASADEGST